MYELIFQLDSFSQLRKNPVGLSRPLGAQLEQVDCPSVKGDPVLSLKSNIHGTHPLYYPCAVRICLKFSLEHPSCLLFDFLYIVLGIAMCFTNNSFNCPQGLDSFEPQRKRFLFCSALTQTTVLD